MDSRDMKRKELGKKAKRKSDIVLGMMFLCMVFVAGCSQNTGVEEGETGTELSMESVTDNGVSNDQGVDSLTEEEIEEITSQSLTEADFIYGCTNGNANNYGILATDGVALYGSHYREQGYLSRFDLQTGTYQTLIEAPVNQINMLDETTILCARNYDSEEGCIVAVQTDGSQERVIWEACPTYMRVVEDWIYYCDATTHYLEKVKIDGTGHEVLCEKACFYISVYEDTLVFQMDEDGETLYRIQTDGSDLQKLTEGAAWYPTCYEGRIYYKALVDETTGEYALQSIDMNGGDVQVLATQEVYAMNLLEKSGEILFSDAQDGKLYSVDMDGENLTEMSEYDHMYQTGTGAGLELRMARQICTAGPFRSLLFVLRNADTQETEGEGARIENSRGMEPMPGSYEEFQKVEQE